MVLWRLAVGPGLWLLNSGVRARLGCCRAKGPLKGLVLLGRAGRVLVGKGPGEQRSVSCERLRDGTGGGGRSKEEEANGDALDSEEEDDEESSACRSDRAEDWREKDEGRVLEENVDGGTEGGARMEEPLVRDWVFRQLLEEEEEEEENKSDVSVSKGSGFHCASLWIPFSPFV